MEERTFKLSIEKAKEWYRGSSQDLKRIALEVYTEEELTKVELPNSWREFIFNHYVNIRLSELIINPNIDNKYKALAKLELLRDCYRQGEDIKTAYIKYNIHYYKDKISTSETYGNAHFLSFQSEEIRDKFLENFSDLIEQAGDLI